MTNLRITSFNVNSLKACIHNQGKKNLEEFLDSFESDIICFQETKLRGVETFGEDDSWANKYEGFCSFSQTLKGYSGVATFVKKDVCVPNRVELGLFSAGSEEHAWVLSKMPSSVENIEKLNAEGRIVITYHDDFILCNIYGPSISSEERIKERMEYKMDFFKALEARLEMLRLRDDLPTNIIILGDFNIAPSPTDYPILDAHFYRSDRPDRIWMRELFSDGQASFVDTFRLFHPDREHAYTCWNTKLHARLHNIGSRIDLIIASKELVDSSDIAIIGADIHPNVPGSDHCPVSVTLKKTTAIPWACSLIPPKESLSVIISSSGGKQKKISSYFAARPISKRKRDTCEKEEQKTIKHCPKPASDNVDVDSRTITRDILERQGIVVTEFVLQEYEASEHYFSKIKEKAKSSWESIQSKYMKAPTCSCQIPAVKKKVTKNSSKKKGRWFYCCSKPLGGGQCNFFQWV